MLRSDALQNRKNGLFAVAAPETCIRRYSQLPKRVYPGLASLPNPVPTNHYHGSGLSVRAGHCRIPPTSNGLVVKCGTTVWDLTYIYSYITWATSQLGSSRCKREIRSCSACVMNAPNPCLHFVASARSQFPYCIVSTVQYLIWWCHFYFYPPRCKCCSNLDFPARCRTGGAVAC